MKKSLGEQGQGFPNDEEAGCSVAGHVCSALTCGNRMAPEGQRRFVRLDPDDLAPSLEGGDWGNGESRLPEEAALSRGPAAEAAGDLTEDDDCTLSPATQEVAHSDGGDNDG